MIEYAGQGGTKAGVETTETVLCSGTVTCESMPPQIHNSQKFKEGGARGKSGCCKAERQGLQNSERAQTTFLDSIKNQTEA